MIEVDVLPIGYLSKIEQERLVALTVDELHNRFEEASSEHFKRCYVTLIASVYFCGSKDCSGFTSCLERCECGNYLLSCLRPTIRSSSISITFTSSSNTITVNSCNCSDHQICPCINTQCSRLERTSVSDPAIGGKNTLEKNNILLAEFTAWLLKEVTLGEHSDDYPVEICFLLSPGLLQFAFKQSCEDFHRLSEALKYVEGILSGNTTDDRGYAQFGKLQRLFRSEAATFAKSFVRNCEGGERYEDDVYALTFKLEDILHTVIGRLIAIARDYCSNESLEILPYYT